MKPQRIQLSRRKGWRMPANSIKVDRTTPWGNPFVVGPHGTRGQCVYLFRLMLAGYLCASRGPDMDVQRAYVELLKKKMPQLRGKNLACWCPIGAPCHGDVLLIVVNDMKRELRAFDATLTTLRGY